MELWDAYNSSFTKIENKTLIRGEIIPQGVFHLVCDIWVRHIDEISVQDGETIDFKWVSKDELLAMKKNELLTKRMQK